MAGGVRLSESRPCPLRHRLLSTWQALNLGVISLNSFIMLIRNPLAGGVNHVVCAAAAATWSRPRSRPAGPPSPPYVSYGFYASYAKEDDGATAARNRGAMRHQNPFKPTAGKMPPVLVGREKVTDDFIEGLENGAGAPGRLMRITGPRGSGKTVLLSELASIARDHGWLVVNVSAAGDLLESIRKRLLKAHTFELDSLKLSVPFGSVEAGRAETNAADFETVFDGAARKMTARGKGLLVTIDEIQDASHDDVREIATAVQFLIRDDQNISLVFAGIPTGVLDLLNGKAMMFLRRAKPEELEAIPLAEVRDSLRRTIEDSGLFADGAALDKAAEATAGYAYLIQLVGYYVWRAAWLRCRELDGPIAVTDADATRGIGEALEEFKDAVLETAISGLPRTSVKFALAMSEMGEVVATADIAEKLGRSTGYLSPYRRRLIGRQVIEQTAPGYVTFSIPFMREFLVERRGEILARYGA